MNGITVRSETRDGSTFLVAEGPTPQDIARELHQRLVTGINGEIDMEFARQLVLLGWTPPLDHPVLGARCKNCGGREPDHIANYYCETFEKRD